MASSLKSSSSSSNSTLRSTNAAYKFYSRNVSAAKMKWLCTICGKKLSSKRSYDEHYNVHTNLRPFACAHCGYAAASQMTLRRHVIRNHIPRQAWGYQCPYCNDMFMEPGGYQQHIISQHTGLSATFGCPMIRCTFTTCSSAFFREHLEKHNNLPPAVYEEAAHRLFRFAVNDKSGFGFSQRSLDLRRVEAVRKMESVVPPNNTKYVKTPHAARKTKQSRKTVKNETVLLDVKEEKTSKHQQQQQQQQQLFEPEEMDFLNNDINYAELEINNFTDCLHDGMVEPELD